MHILKLNLFLNSAGFSKFNFLNKVLMNQPIFTSRQFATTTLLQTEKSKPGKKEESTRMKQFHKKLRLQPIPRVPPRERFVDLVLVETNPKNGEAITDSEKDPTKWGDWQNGGRVTDF
ncbi:uncharacterized protein LOC117602435 [Osmia lignaria lignaria]|uniref:uncharacterized protein LOC117602435 n=1 Tax=Osmia lignaria lignaria TaxID=1437193 RepID=UPI00402BA19B